MSLSLEWRHRIQNWHKELPRHFLRPLGVLDLEGFVTREHLSLSQAERGDFRPMPPGTRWGAKWEYGWFRGSIQLPAAAAGQRIVLCPDVGGEALVAVNGQLAGAVDREHRAITLTRQALAGTRYDILMEAYAGHGPLVVGTGPTPPGREPVPEPGPTQATVGESTFGIWNEDAYQLWLDVETLFQLRELLDANALRTAEIDAGLRDFALIVDFEADEEERWDSVRAARERLRPLLECVNGSTAPTLFAFGHAHIDVAWLWPLAETERKAGRTFATQLALMEEYPEYRFLQSQPHLYTMVRERYPELYTRIKEAAARGQFIPDGAAWVEPDTNVTGGESLIRQLIHGKRFFREEFGVECELLWLPDVFGYSGALPQILRGCGIKYFSTQKIFWAYNGGDPFPYNTFIWEGIDGSEVYTHLHNDYNSRTDPTSVAQRWNERVQKDGFSTRLFPFGHGDGGGGPTRDHLEFVRRQVNLEGLPRVRMAAPVEYFRDQEARGWPQQRYVGELYFQAHRGTYTSQARVKRGNRKCEIALREAELWAVAAQSLAGQPVPGAVLDQAWKMVLLNQFHDILPGSSIHRVYEEAEADHARVLSSANSVAAHAMRALAGDGQALVAFNSLSWPRHALVPLPPDYRGARDVTGQALPVQEIDGQRWTEATLPPCGWTTLWPAPPAAIDNTLRVMPHLLENECLRIELNEHGEIAHLFDKEADRELSAGPCNGFRMYKDVPTNWDAWDIDSIYALTPVELPEKATIEVLDAGPLIARLLVTRRLNRSRLTQVISLRRGSRCIEFQSEIDWQESHKLLKVAFPVTIHANEALHEIQFGHIRRPNHTSRPFDADRFEVCAHKWTALVEEGRGCAVLNDCKYGVNVLGNTIALTLLKSALAPDMTADKGRQRFTYAFYAWNGPFAGCPVVQTAYELNVPVTTCAGAAGERSLFVLDAPNIVIETVKPAEDGSGDVVVRLYEAKRTATRCALMTTLPVTRAAQTDMLERDQAPLRLTEGCVELDFRPFEIKTVRFSR
jgi:alpha-mannosidase